MTSLAPSQLIPKLFLLIYLFHFSFATRNLHELAQNQNNQLMQYHKGPLLCGNITVNLIWYGKFKPSQRAIIADFITSLSSPPLEESEPSVATWWKTIDKYYHIASNKYSTPSLYLGKQIIDETYSLGKTLTLVQIVELAKKGAHGNSINVVLTSQDVIVDGFCMDTCGSHAYKTAHVKEVSYRYAFIWIGNSETQCPGTCAWPFHKPVYGPQNPPLVAPNNDVGLDGMVINLGSLLAGTVTNPYGNGFYQGDTGAPLEAASACPGIFGNGAYPGYPGKLLVDPKTAASYNAYGINRRKYLLPSIYDPSASSCSIFI